ncbi:MAG: hypothetical protein E7Z91_03070 [Cyanobacteria bacterium SIG30]|nr:hypothetical protein [Cyanobacteria bacterium SIG30]
MAKYLKRILIDLDGVLNEYGVEKFNENYIPKIKKGAFNFVKKLSRDYELYLFTTRNLMLSTKWLIDNKLDVFFKDVTNVKIPAYLHIDDRAICFEGDYTKTIDKIKTFNVFWKNKNK